MKEPHRYSVWNGHERRGLLAEPNRTEAGYRIYPPETARGVRFIKRGQDLGVDKDRGDRREASKPHRFEDGAGDTRGKL